jgi:hypothetical protein
MGGDVEPADGIPLEGRYTRLRPLRPAFVEQLFELATTTQIPWQWQGPETPEAFRESLWHRVLVQFAVEDRRTGRGVGLLRADNANPVSGFAYLTMMIFPEFRMRAWPLEAAVLFGNYLFQRFNLQRLYAETTESYFEQFRSGAGQLFEVEGRLREDLYILTFTRERWLAEGVPAVERCTRRATRPAEPVT